MAKETLFLSAGNRTNELLKFVLSELSDDEVDAIEVQREVQRDAGLAREPVTTSAVLALASTMTIVVGRLIERWLQANAHETHLKIVYRAAEGSGPEVAEILARLADKYADVEIRHGSLELPKSK